MMQANGNPYPYAPYLGAAAGAIHGPRAMPKKTHRFDPSGGNPIRKMAMSTLANKLNNATTLSPQAAKEILKDNHLKLGGILSGALESLARKGE